MAKRVIIRCRRCWEDVAIQKDSDEVKPCPKCRKAQTYKHAFVSVSGKSYRKKER